MSGNRNNNSNTDILIQQQSFEEDLNRYNSRQINTTESQNVTKLFDNTTGRVLDCNICYEETKCLQCYQCDFYYCKECMIKIISEFKKCSACQCTFLNKYNLITKKNQTKVKDNKPTTNHIITNQNVTSSKYENDLDLYTCNLEIAMHNSLELNYPTKPTSSTISYPLITSPNEIYYNELTNNEILPYDMSSPKTTIPYFTGRYIRNEKILEFRAYNYTFPEIQINYKKYNTIFQSRIRLFLLQILNYPDLFRDLWIGTNNIIKKYDKDSDIYRYLYQLANLKYNLNVDIKTI